MLLGLLTLLAGIGQRTIWAPSETFTAAVPADAAAAPLTVIDQKLRTAHEGPVKVTVQGDGNFILAAGRPDDVQAWVGQTAHNTISGVSEDGKSLQVEHADGDATAPNPAGSDLWVSSENASGGLEYTWTPPADGDWSLLLAADGTKPAPASVSMTFPNDTSTPWAVPLMVIGGLLILGGIALAVLSGRRKDGADAEGGTGGSGYAQRARARIQAKSSSSRMTMLAAGMTAAVLAGTAAGAQAASPSPTPSGNAAAPAGGLPVLLDSQFRRILEQVSSATDAGDAAKDASKLADRVAGPELEVRTQNYKIRSQVGSYEARMPVRSTKLLTTVVTSDRTWPRSVLAVTQGDGNVVPQILPQVQQSPRENNKLM
ncbi:MAG: hypothetical protein HOQ04_00615, partial [Pseudarthrobacter sp.]|nr:hypothetical protein [Pseudarthrobacter sp.]